MTTPLTGDDGGFWVQFTLAAAAVLGAIFGIVRWLLGKIDAVRVSNDQQVERLRAELVAKMDVQRAEVVSRVDAHARDYREDRAEAQKWREQTAATMASMVTRAELERQLDRQSDNILERLDVRVRPLLEGQRKARGGD